MSEFIGSRISLISKSDIRYVGTLHEINSENSTVALEQVVSHGTEGRRGGNEIAGSDSVYEYIVFRGSDVKDLRIEEAPKESKPPPPPQVPDDPAILGSGARPQPLGGQQPPHQQNQARPPNFQNQQPPFPQHGQFPNQRFGPPPGPQPGFQGPPGQFQGYHGMPYGGPPPPGWHGPPGQGFPYPPGPFPPHQQMPFNGPGPQPNQEQQPLPQPASVATPPVTDGPPPQPQTSAEDAGAQPTSKSTSKPTSQQTTPAPQAPAAQAPPPPVESKPNVAAALATPNPAKVPGVLPIMPKPVPTGPKSNRIVPAVPLASPRGKAAAIPAGALQPSPGNTTQASARTQYQNATNAATAAVAAAMAKLPPQPGLPGAAPSNAVDNLTKKVNEMRTDARQPRQQSGSNYNASQRGSRGGPRRGGREQGKGIEVPKTEFDFETANAKFNKQDLVKEAIASGSPVGNPADGEPAATNGTDGAEANGTTEIAASPPAAVGYNKASSFFDNISSDSRDREEQADGRRKPSGQEFRTAERNRNLETFGLGSVDGSRGGYRGRGRGRGGYGRGRGGGARGSFRGAPAGNSGAASIPATGGGA